MVARRLFLAGLQAMKQADAHLSTMDGEAGWWPARRSKECEGGSSFQPSFRCGLTGVLGLGTAGLCRISERWRSGVLTGVSGIDR